jgi:hypothetical protein
MSPKISNQWGLNLIGLKFSGGTEGKEEEFFIGFWLLFLIG